MQNRIREYLKTQFLALEERFEKQDQPAGVEFGFPDIDRHIAGFLPGELCLIAGRPGMGKTSFLISSALEQINQRVRVLHFSTEHTPAEISNRFLSAEALVDAQRIRTGRLTEQDWAKITRAAGTLGESQLYIEYAPWLSLIRVREVLAGMTKQEVKPDVVFIDRLSSMIFGEKVEDGANNRAHELFKIVVELKRLGVEYGVPIIAVADINKGMEARLDKRPFLYDLKDHSTALETYADFVFALHRELYVTDQGGSATLAEVIGIKSRRTEFFYAKLAFIGAYGRWRSLLPEKTAG